MQIQSIEILNFKGLKNFKIDDFTYNLVLVGKNDSGKTNLCYAIRKFFDSGIRSINFNDADSTNSNKGNIEIIIKLNLEGISVDNRSILGTFVDNDNTLTVSLIAEYDNDIGQYNESIIFGSTDKSRKIVTNIINPLDKVLDVIYIYLGYDLNKDKKRTFHKKII